MIVSHLVKYIGRYCRDNRFFRRPVRSIVGVHYTLASLQPAFRHVPPVYRNPDETSRAVRRILRKLGQNIQDARKRRGLTMATVADRAFTSRKTLARVEKGDHGVSVGIYASVLQALNLLDRLADVADPRNDELGLSLSASGLPRRVRARK